MGPREGLYWHRQEERSPRGRQHHEDHQEDACQRATRRCGQTTLCRVAPWRRRRSKSRGTRRTPSMRVWPSRRRSLLPWWSATPRQEGDQTVASEGCDCLHQKTWRSARHRVTHWFVNIVNRGTMWTVHPLTLHIQRSTVFAQARNASHALGSMIAWHLCTPEKSLSSGLIHDSSLLVVASPAVHHEHIFFLIHSFFYHNSRTRTTIGTTRSSPRTPSAWSTSPRTTCLKASLSRTTLSWKPAEWRNPAQHILHRLWARGACDGVKDNRSISTIWYTERMWRTRSSSSDPRRSEFGEIGTHGLRNYQSNDSEISGTSYFQSHMHFDDSAESITDSDLEDGELQKMQTSPLYAQIASGKPDALVVPERGKCKNWSRKRKFEVSFIWGSESFRETWCMVYLLGPMTWKVTRRNVWKHIVNLRNTDSTIMQSRNVMRGCIIF